jgi:hypothetical protein
VIKTLFAAAALTVAVSAPAFAGEAERTFSRDGVTYTYTATDMGEYKLLQGRAYPSGSAFRLTVRGDKVRGVSGGTPVSFRVKDKSTMGGSATAAR